MTRLIVIGALRVPGGLVFFVTGGLPGLDTTRGARPYRKAAVLLSVAERHGVIP